jgi:hypothetical protein
LFVDLIWRNLLYIPVERETLFRVSLAQSIPELLFHRAVAVTGSIFSQAVGRTGVCHPITSNRDGCHCRAYQSSGMVLLTTRKRLKIPPWRGGQLFKILSHLNENPVGEAGFSFSVSMIVVRSPLKLTLYRLP